MSPLILVLIALLLLFLNAFFVAAEFAVISARRSTIEPRAREGSRSARTTLYAMENVSLMLACAQLGITICSLGLGALGEPAVARLIEGPLDSLGVSDALLHPIAFALALGLVVYLHVVFGEMVPKNVALAVPDRAALAFAPPLVLIAKLLGPIIKALNWLANCVLRVMRVTPKDEVTSAFTRDEVAALVAESHREGLLDPGEQLLLTGALEFGQRNARSITIPLRTVVSVPVGVTPRVVELKAARTGYSRFPVRDDDGLLAGYLHIKDVLQVDEDDLQRPTSPDLVRPLPSVNADEQLRTVLATLQRTGAHMAQVTDGAGTVLGLVALEDVLEELVGEITDELSQRRAT